MSSTLRKDQLLKLSDFEDQNAYTTYRFINNMNDIPISIPADPKLSWNRFNINIGIAF